MDLLTLLGLVGLLFVKEVGLPVPVPGDLLVIGAGVAAAGLGPAATGPLAAILVAGFAGGAIQFLLVRGALRPAMLGILARVGVPRGRLDDLAERLRRRGARGVAVARATPGVRIGAIAASGLAALPFAVFLRGLIGGNGIFVSGHFALGFFLGAPVIEAAAGSAAVLLAVGAILAIAGAAGWWLLRRRRARPAARQPGAASSLGDWADAACPACLALAVVTRGAAVTRGRVLG